MSESRLPEATAVAEIVRESTLPIFKQPSDHGTSAPLIVNPRTCQVTSLESLLPRPCRKRAAVLLRDHDSFIDYVQLHREPGTMLFGNFDTTGASFMAVLNYHQSNADPAAADFQPGVPGWGDHTATLRLEHTQEWQLWNKHSGRAMSQTEFALFLEDNRLDIVQPEAAEIIDIAKSLEASTGSKFKSQVRLDNGDRTFAYESQTTATAGANGRLTIPEKLRLLMPVFLNGPAFPMDAFFRYRLKDGELVLFYNLIRPHKVVEAAVATSRDAITAATKLLVHHGQLQSCGL